MNQIFNGSTLLGVVLLITLLLFLIALFLKPKPTTAKTHRSKKMNQQTLKGKKTHSKKFQFQSKPGTFSSVSKSQLIKLKNLIKINFPDFNAIMREQHLVLERNAKKVAMLTLDVNAALGRRRLGEVTVINFHKLPSVEELRIELSGV